MSCILVQVQNLILVVSHCSDALGRKRVVLPQKLLHFSRLSLQWLLTVGGLKQEKN